MMDASQVRSQAVLDQLSAIIRDNPEARIRCTLQGCTPEDVTNVATTLIRIYQWYHDRMPEDYQIELYMEDSPDGQ
jgi:hypothetical protein